MGLLGFLLEWTSLPTMVVAAPLEAISKANRRKIKNKKKLFELKDDESVKFVIEHTTHKFNNQYKLTTIDGVEQYIVINDKKSKHHHIQLLNAQEEIIANIVEQISLLSFTKEYLIDIRNNRLGRVVSNKGYTTDVYGWNISGRAFNHTITCGNDKVMSMSHQRGEAKEYFYVNIYKPAYQLECICISLALIASLRSRYDERKKSIKNFGFYG